MRQLLLLVACTLVTCWTLDALAVDLYVSPQGNDSNPGTLEQPFKTVQAAQQAARRDTDQRRTIWLDEGTYYLTRPLVFTSEDSGTSEAPFTLAAMPGKRPRLSGGARVTLRWRPFKGAIVMASTPPGLRFDQLFVDGNKQPMARWPNYDPSSRYFQGFSPDCTSPHRVDSWADPKGGFLHAMHRSLWGDMHWLITGKTAEGQLQLVGGWQNNRQMGAHGEFRFVENIREELDAPGEWFLDGPNETLYYFPPPSVDLRTSKVEIVRLPHVIEFRGDPGEPVRHIKLKGLHVTHAARTFMENREPLVRSDWTTYRGGAILIHGAENCEVRDCMIDQVGGNGIFIDKYNRRVTISGCLISDAGASAISFVGSPKALRSPLFEYHQTQSLAAMDHVAGPGTPDYPAECLVDDCLIFANGRVEKQTAGVNICIAESITIRRCSIYDCPRAGINICDGAFGGHLIELCDVFDTVKETGDHGSFNAWGRDRFWHPDRKQTARWVQQYPDMPTWDSRKTTVIRNNRWRCDHGWDIDLDDGSSNYEIFNNLCLAGGIKLREGYRRRVFNNVLVDYTFCPHVWYPKSDTTFQRNIIWQDGYAAAGMKSTDQGDLIDYNLVHRPGSVAAPADGLAKFGGDRHSLVGDAQFLASETGDYRVASTSPARQLGFRNFAMDHFGVQKPSLRAIARKPPLPGSLAAARIASGGWGRTYRTPQSAHWLGAQVRDIRTDGEVSALGLGEARGVLIDSVASDGPASRADLQPLDVILAIDAEPVPNLKQLAQVWQQHEQNADSPVSLTIWRDQTKRSICILVADAAPSNSSPNAPPVPTSPTGRQSTAP